MDRRVGLVALALLLLPACGSDEEDPGRDPVEEAASARITASSFTFSPDSIEVEPGTLEVTLVNEDEVNHTFTLEDPAFEIEAAGGEDAAGTFDVPEGEATYGFFCRFHPDSMRGEMIVGEGGTGSGSDGPPEDDGAYDY